MTSVTEQVKKGLLLSFHDFSKTYSILKTVVITRNAKGIDITNEKISAGKLGKTFPDISLPAITVLKQFSQETVENQKKQLKDAYNKQALDISLDTYLQKSLTRHFHTHFQQLKTYASSLKMYHSVATSNNRFATSPCVFNTIKPVLLFEVVEENNLLKLVTSVDIDGAIFDFGFFKRHLFFLEKENHYYLLSFKNYQTLDWLIDQNPEQYGTNPDVLAEKILSVLEEDYSVKRNNHFKKKAIEAKALNQLRLSELNNSFLMLTPQWLYDGFAIDGPWEESVEIIRDGKTYAILRDKETESSFVQLLESLHPNFSSQMNGYYYLSFAEAQKKQWFMKVYHQLLTTDDIEIVGMDMLKYFRFSSHPVKTIVDIIDEKKHVLSVRMQVSFGEEMIRLNELQKILYAGQKMVLLKDGSLGILDDEWMNKYAVIIKHGKIDKDVVHVAKSIAIGHQDNSGSDNVLAATVQKDWWQRWKQWLDANGSENLFPVPSTVNASLRNYQQKGYEWMRLLAEMNTGGCLADDMGLGKTLQSICLLAWYAELNTKKKSIIICPASLIYNWQKELEKFVPSINVLLYYGGQRSKEKLLEEDVQIIITSYGTLRADAEVILGNKFGVAIIDESHNIKNPSAQITQALNTLDAEIAFALSGTPVVNNTVDLYSQLNIVLPGLFGTREFFKREYADPIDRFGDEQKTQALQKLTAPFILRRTKEQVAKDLPEKSESVLWCTMGSQQRAVYEEIKEQVRSSIFLDIKNNGLAKSKLDVIHAILKLRQVCNSPMLLPEDERTSSESVKTKVLLEELRNILGAHKALVFSQFSSMLNILAEECKKEGIAFYHFDGQTPPAKRAEMVSAFQEEGNTTNLFLISLKAGNAGLNLTAADYVFLFDPWWNTAIQQQAIDRAHRIGQQKNVFAYKMICKNTIEEKIVKLQEKKKQLADELISADESFVKGLTEQDIEYLFE